LLAQQKRSISNISFGFLDFDNISLILQACQINPCKSKLNGIYLGLAALLSHIIHLDLQFGVGIFKIYAPILNYEINPPKFDLVGLDLRLSSHSPLIITCTN